MSDNTRAPWWRWYLSPAWWRYWTGRLAWKLRHRHRPFARTYIDLWRHGPVLIHLAHCRNRRFRLRRLHCGTEPTSWRTRRMAAGLGIRAGWWLLTVGLFQRWSALRNTGANQ